MSAPGLAIFDLDYTLTKRGTWGRFVVRAVKYRPYIWLPLLCAAGFAQWRYKQGAIERVRVKQAMMRWAIKGWSQEKVEELGVAFAKEEVATGLRSGAIRALEEHRKRGDQIIIASAAVNVIVAPIANLLKVDHWVATDMAFSGGVLSPEFATPNCYGAEKLRRVEVLLEQNPTLKQKNTVITMYSDSYSDLDIMRFAHVGVAVNPDKKLRVLSAEHNFEIVDWMS
ncbi:MAG: HAD family hydrolase [Maricaulaceae bacterium]